MKLQGKRQFLGIGGALLLGSAILAGCGNAPSQPVTQAEVNRQVELTRQGAQRPVTPQSEADKQRALMQTGKP